MAAVRRRQRLPDLRRARDRRRARRKVVVRRRDGLRRLAGQRLGVAGVVGEAHPHLDRLVLVVRHQRVGACRRRQGDVRLVAAVHPDPLVHVVDGGQPVGILDVCGVRRQRLPDLRRARDRRRARRGGVGCPPDLEAEGGSADSPEVPFEGDLITRVAEAPSHCRAGVQGPVGQADPQPRAIGFDGIGRDHPVGRAGIQRGVVRGREAVDGVVLDRARIGQADQYGSGVRIAPVVLVNIDRRGGGTSWPIKLSIKIYPDAGQRIGAGARGERYGLNQG